MPKLCIETIYVSPDISHVLVHKNANGDFTSTIKIADVKPDEGNVALRYLWARDRIASLSDFGNGDASPDDVKAVTELGLKYNLLTPYTSFVAVREKIVNPNGDAEDVDQPLPLPEGVMDTAVGSEPEMWWLMVASILAVALLSLRRRISLIDAMCRRVNL